jgi:hypothetical protein
MAGAPVWRKLPHALCFRVAVDLAYFLPSPCLGKMCGGQPFERWGFLKIGVTPEPRCELAWLPAMWPIRPGGIMNFVDLIVVVCSLTNPASCKEQHLLLQTEGSLNSCIMQAQPYLAKWIGDHPSYQIVRWHCEWPDAEDKKT